MAVSTRRDSAVAARERAIAAGAEKNIVPALILAQSMFESSDRALQRGDQSLALRGYVEAAQAYGRARDEARAMDREAQHMIERVSPVVQAIPTGRAASNAGVFSGAPESLLHEQDFTLAKVAAQSAEQIGIDAGIAPPSAQPPAARAAVDVLLSDLGRALASQRISNIRVLYPGLTESERHGWETFFATGIRSPQSSRWRISPSAAAPRTATCGRCSNTCRLAGAHARVDRRRFAMRFERKEVDGGWRRLRN